MSFEQIIVLGPYELLCMSLLVRLERMVSVFQKKNEALIEFDLLFWIWFEL